MSLGEKRLSGLFMNVQIIINKCGYSSEFLFYHQTSSTTTKFEKKTELKIHCMQLVSLPSLKLCTCFCKSINGIEVNNHTNINLRAILKNWMLILVLLCENECQRWDASRYIKARSEAQRFYVYRDASHLWHSFSHNRTKINIQNL